MHGWCSEWTSRCSVGVDEREMSLPKKGFVGELKKEFVGEGNTGESKKGFVGEENTGESKKGFVGE